MSEQLQASALNQSRASKIQIEVKDIAQATTTKSTKSQLNTDADGSDLSNE